LPVPNDEYVEQLIPPSYDIKYNIIKYCIKNLVINIL
jgi:hypothetical protein